MNLEDKEGIVLPVGDEELENAAGGFAPKMSRVYYHCTTCHYRCFRSGNSRECPKCHTTMEILIVSHQF